MVTKRYSTKKPRNISEANLLFLLGGASHAAFRNYMSCAKLTISRQASREIDIGRPSRAFPVTPPCVRVRTRRLAWLFEHGILEGRKSKPREVQVWKGYRQTRTAADVPVVAAAARCLGRQVRLDAPLHQFSVSRPTPFPALPNLAPKASSQPAVEVP
jgi:hypothetical protein